MKRLAVTLLAGIMVLGSTALGDEIVFDDGFAAENEAIEISTDAEMEEEFFDSEDGFFFEDEINEESFEEITELDFSGDEEVLDAASLIEDFEETADEDALTLADDADIPIDEDHFPDERFREYIRFNADKDENGFLSVDEISMIVIMYVNDRGITTLEGIQYFTALVNLNCSANQLTSLDVSQLSNLTCLSCVGNQLNELDISKNTELGLLNCSANQLKELDVSKNTKLSELYCGANQIESIDVTQNTELERLDCDENQFKTLDVNCCTKLRSLNCSSNQLTSLKVDECVDLSTLWCRNNQLTSLNIDKLMRLLSLSCASNQLKSLDVSGRENLSDLTCYGNKLENLEISGCRSLDSLFCYDNLLKTLDISPCQELMNIYSNGNHLSYNDGSEYYYDDGYSNLLRFDSTVVLITPDGLVHMSHTYGDWTITTPATCGTDGVKTHKCTGCDAEESEIIPATGIHTPVTDPAVAPTCTKTGLTEGSHCSTCDTVIIEQREVAVDKNRHPEDKIVTDPAVAPTTASEGKTEGSHCSACGAVIVAQQTVPKKAPDNTGGESGTSGSGSANGSANNGSTGIATDTTVTPQPAAPVAVPDQITVTKKPSIKKPEATANKITINWTNIKTTSKKTKAIWKKIKKVQIQCATDKAFKNIVKTTTVGKNKTKAAIKGLKKNTTYYVRVRYYDGTGYSAWSSVKKIKTKKK